MPKWVLLAPLALFLSGIFGKTFVNLGYLLIANSSFYYALFKLADWSQTLALYYPSGVKLYPFHLEWTRFWQSASPGGYLFAFTLYSTFVLTFWAGMFFNKGYLAEGASHDFNLFVAQFLVWFSAPAAFISMNWVYYNKLPAWPDVVALCFYALGTSFRYIFSK